MGIRFQCTNCQAIQAANERLLGREIKCPKCGHLVLLPSRAQVDAARLAKADEKRLERELGRIAPVSRTSARPKRKAAVAEPDAPEDYDAQLAAEERALAASTANFKRPKPPPGEDMDMTPMVDVTFLLLIFFMITASFSVQKSIQRPAQRNEEASSQPITNPEDDPDIVTVQVDEFNAYNVVTSEWDRPASSKQDLIVALSEAHGGDSSGNVPTKLIVQAHEDSLHATVIGALDAGREAAFESFEVKTVEEFN